MKKYKKQLIKPKYRVNANKHQTIRKNRQTKDTETTFSIYYFGLIGVCMSLIVLFPHLLAIICTALVLACIILLIKK